MFEALQDVMKDKNKLSVKVNLRVQPCKIFSFERVFGSEKKRFGSRPSHGILCSSSPGDGQFLPIIYIIVSKGFSRNENNFEWIYRYFLFFF